MSDEFEIKDENDEADIDLSAPIVDDEEAEPDEEIEGDGTEMTLRKAAKEGLIEADEEDLEDEDDETDPIEDDFNADYEE